MKCHPPRRIIVVDDDPVFCDRLSRSLSSRGHDILPASGLEDLEEKLDGNSYECAVVDLKLGDASGLEVARFLRERFPAIRVLILTGYGSIATAVDAMRLGAVDYLSKPADTDQVEAALFDESGGSSSSTPSVPSLERVEWEHLQRVLHDNGGNISATARVLGIERRTLQRKLYKYPPEN